MEEEEKPAEENRKCCQSKLSKLVLYGETLVSFKIQLLFFFEKCFYVGGLNLGQFLIGLGVGSAAAMLPQLEASVKKCHLALPTLAEDIKLFHRTNTAERQSAITSHSSVREDRLKINVTFLTFALFQWLRSLWARSWAPACAPPSAQGSAAGGPPPPPPPSQWQGGNCR